MSTDIVEELDGRCGMRHCEDHPWLGRAADEIERLRAHTVALEAMAKNVCWWMTEYNEPCRSSEDPEALCPRCFAIHVLAGGLS